MILYNYDCDGVMNINAVRIPAVMLTGEPKADKINSRITNFKKCHTLKPIKVTMENVMTDGLISLIVARRLGMTEVPYVISDREMTVKNTVMFPNTRWYSSSNPKKNPTIEHRAKETSNKRGHKYDNNMYKSLFEKQRGKCYICSREMTLDAKKKNQLELATTDHIIPLALGGSTGTNNLALCCHRCNELKGSLMMSDLLRRVIIDQRKFEDSIGYKSVIK